jgi:ATP dependent DNA ligase domain
MPPRFPRLRRGLRKGVGESGYALRAGRERPCRRAAEQRDEVATADASCHLIPPAEGKCGPMIAQSVAALPKDKKGFPVSGPAVYLGHMLRTFLAGFIAPCLPTKIEKLPSGSQWLHEIKHDGFRVIARKDGDRVWLYSRPGNDLNHRFPLIGEALAGLR